MEEMDENSLNVKSGAQFPVLGLSLAPLSSHLEPSCCVKAQKSLAKRSAIEPRILQIRVNILSHKISLHLQSSRLRGQNLRCHLVEPLSD